MLPFLALLLINSAKVLSGLENIDGVTSSIDNWSLSSLGVFGDFECESECLHHVKA